MRLEAVIGLSKRLLLNNSVPCSEALSNCLLVGPFLLARGNGEGLALRAQILQAWMVVTQEALRDVALTVVGVLLLLVLLLGMARGCGHRRGCR